MLKTLFIRFDINSMLSLKAKQQLRAKKNPIMQMQYRSILYIIKNYYCTIKVVHSSDLPLKLCLLFKCSNLYPIHSYKTNAHWPIQTYQHMCIR